MRVTVVTGFLGAGKTTLLDAWLSALRGEDVAVIVNEVGELGVDGELLAARARRVIEITGGCICCTTQRELVRALAELAARSSPPARLFVETSGAASPAGVLRAVARTGGAVLDGVVTVVDATRAAVIDAQTLAAEQVGYADVVVLSRAELCDAERLADARERTRRRTALAAIVESERGRLRGAETLEALLARRDVELPRVVMQRAHEGIESLSLEHAGELDEDRFLAWMEDELGACAGRLLRSKGIVAIEGVDARVVVQGVADAAEVTLGAPWADARRTSRMVLVGFALPSESLCASFAACGAHAAND